MSSPDVRLERTLPLQNIPSAYLLSLTVEGVRCFGSEETLDLTGKAGEHAQWTVIMGENGVGKSTLLQCIAFMVPTMQMSKHRESQSEHFVDVWGGVSVPSFMQDVSEHNSVLFGFGPSSIGISFFSSSDQTSIFSFDSKITNYRAEVSRGAPAPIVTRAFGYGASRTYGATTLAEQDATDDPVGSLFDEAIPLRNPEEWLLRTDYASKQEGPRQNESRTRLGQIIETLIDVLPEIDDIRISPPTETRKTARAEFHTPYGWVPLAGLGLGYRTMTAWMVDLASRMFDAYPESKDPLREPAVVLIDEIDLHMHPRWQRTIIDYLSERFPKTQFIATAHSPLIAQAARNANLVVLRRVENPDGDDYVTIDNDPEIVANWRVDQILTSLFDIETARPPEIEPLLTERREILGKPTLSDEDRERLRALNREIGALPTAERPEDIEAMDIIRRAAALLKDDSAKV